MGTLHREVWQARIAAASQDGGEVTKDEELSDNVDQEATDDAEVSSFFFKDNLIHTTNGFEKIRGFLPPTMKDLNSLMHYPSTSIPRQRKHSSALGVA